MSRAVLSILAIALDFRHDAGVTTTTSAPRTARDRARAELTNEIKAVGLRHLEEHGAAGVSLRAVARDLGMVSSAVYRYFPSRDHLLTALIIDAYHALGEAVETAEAAVDRADVAERFATVGRAARAWARANPHQYGLVYGSPVPGYAAPEDTIGPATRVAFVLRDVLRDAWRSGALRAPTTMPRSAAVWADLHRLAADFFTDVPEAVVARGLLAWTQLFGGINFELFGHLHTVITDYDAWYEELLAEMVAFVGLDA
jgi:AcrR family transcriptional regulator